MARRVLIGIAGGSGSGKTLVARNILRELGSDRVVVIDQDSYYRTLLQAGLGPALRDLASRSPVPVAVNAASDRFPTEVETAAYFVACEGLTNAVKHAGATNVRLEVARRDSTLIVSVADDGAGGAKIDHGSGLTGLSDRVGALGGRLLIDSGVGCGTTLRAELPCVS
jgi:signal transduction histidine kinase